MTARCPACYGRIRGTTLAHLCPARATGAGPAPTPTRRRSTTIRVLEPRVAPEQPYSQPYSIQPFLDHQDAQRASVAVRWVSVLDPSQRCVTMALDAARAGDLKEMAFHLKTMEELWWAVEHSEMESDNVEVEVVA